MGNLSIASPHRVLIVGCAYGGISAIVNLLDLERGKARQPVYPGAEFGGRKSRDGIEITVIDERDGYFHSVGAPLAHVAPKHTSLMWKRFNQLNELRHPNLHFKHGSVKRLDQESKVAEWLDRNGKTQHQAYDYLVMATGLKRHWPAVPKSGSYEEYLQDGKAFISKVVGGDPEKPQEGRRVVIIGAGAVGIEFAGEIKNYYPGIKVTLIHSRDQVLSSEPLPSEVKDRVGKMLVEEGVEVILGNRASVTEQANEQFKVELVNGTLLTADFVIDSTKKGEPTTGTLPRECLNEDGEIVVNQDLTFKHGANKESHFGVGDVIAWTGIKRAGSAMVMGQAAAWNIFASILNSESPIPSSPTSASSDASPPSSSEPSPSNSPTSSNLPLPPSDKISMTELPSWPAVIGIAVGKQCLTYDEKSGMKYGVEVMQGYFQDDLGWAANLKYCQLTDVVEREEVEVEDKNVGLGDVGVEVSAAA
ncbi:apoptosis inducing factor [Lentithecium fluviatile CBS 122367]|uniref:Apoptosis inducing factor n=1 Tax=Lentithecium fluviatile CBS 122367 TaxID=1168545 RepID=A0A6G1J724_9PLEO|nr:apoptosis inducing factor [Lentithecium fluviatile CBS 122367]